VISGTAKRMTDERDSGSMAASDKDKGAYLSHRRLSPFASIARLVRRHL
jgi:hypothetical protein